MDEKPAKKVMRSLTDADYAEIFQAVQERYPPVNSQEAEEEKDDFEKIIDYDEDFVSDYIDKFVAETEKHESDVKTVSLSKKTDPGKKLKDQTDSNRPSIGKCDGKPSCQPEDKSQVPTVDITHNKGSFDVSTIAGNKENSEAVPFKKRSADVKQNAPQTEQKSASKLSEKKRTPKFSPKTVFQKKKFNKENKENEESKQQAGSNELSATHSSLLGKSLNKKQRMRERPVEETGTWVQCERASCLKWRYLADVSDPSLLPDTWTCSMHPDASLASCEAAEEDWDESQHVFTRFTEGSIVWARLPGFPYWPGMVEVDPDLNQFCWCSHRTPNIATQYHVVFLDDKVSRAWVMATHLKPFSEKHPGPSTVQGRSFNKAIRRAKERAEEALRLPLQERIFAYSFATRYRGRWGDGPLPEKSEKIPEKKLSQTEKADKTLQKALRESLKESKKAAKLAKLREKEEPRVAKQKASSEKRKAKQPRVKKSRPEGKATQKRRRSDEGYGWESEEEEDVESVEEIIRTAENVLDDFLSNHSQNSNERKCAGKTAHMSPPRKRRKVCREDTSESEDGPVFSEEERSSRGQSSNASSPQKQETSFEKDESKQDTSDDEEKSKCVDARSCMEEDEDREISHDKLSMQVSKSEQQETTGKILALKSTATEEGVSKITPVKSPTDIPLTPLQTPKKITPDRPKQGRKHVKPPDFNVVKQDINNNEDITMEEGISRETKEESTKDEDKEDSSKPYISKVKSTQPSASKKGKANKDAAEKKPRKADSLKNKEKPKESSDKEGNIQGSSSKNTPLSGDKTEGSTDTNLETEAKPKKPVFKAPAALNTGQESKKKPTFAAPRKTLGVKPGGGSKSNKPASLLNSDVFTQELSQAPAKVPPSTEMPETSAESDEKENIQTESTIADHGAVRGPSTNTEGNNDGVMITNESRAASESKVKADPVSDIKGNSGESSGEEDTAVSILRRKAQKKQEVRSPTALPSSSDSESETNAKSRKKTKGKKPKAEPASKKAGKEAQKKKPQNKATVPNAFPINTTHEVHENIENIDENTGVHDEINVKQMSETDATAAMLTPSASSSQGSDAFDLDIDTDAPVSKTTNDVVSGNATETAPQPDQDSDFSFDE